MFYRWHFSPLRLAKMSPNMNLNCWKCKKNQGTFYHMWWSCKEAQRYWRRIKKWLEEITAEQIEMKPEFFLLGISYRQFPKKIKYINLHILTAARLSYAQCWKQPDIPTEEMTIQKIANCEEMDKLTLALKDKESSEYYKSWSCWYDWIE
uniref:Reverse transcriptase zinc-binding domain-containing protein n=1 Tax=Micrurus corallinus TaxID=54390 RepID=A0A2D4EZ94_MICCO